MKTKTKNRLPDTNGQPEKEKESVTIPAINRRRIIFGIRSTTSLVMHKWSEKQKKAMRDKHAGKKTKVREVRNPEQEAEDATHRTENGEIGIPAEALKASMLNAAHKDFGIPKTLVSKALFFKLDDANNVIPFTSHTPPVMREDTVRVGSGSSDLRYRPEFRQWSATIEFEVDADILQKNDVINLAERAGFGVGLLEMRPEKHGDFGRFEVDATVPILWEEKVKS